MKRWKKLAIGGAATVAIGAVSAFAYFQLVKAGVIRYNQFDRRAKGELFVGGSAPDMTLKTYGGGALRLSELWATKPVFLVFGSCT